MAENIYKDWFNEDPSKRTLIIIRPTVIFGEGNRGNVYNLLNQINSKKFAMFGNGKNKKSPKIYDQEEAQRKCWELYLYFYDKHWEIK